MENALIENHDFLNTLSDEQMKACTFNQNYILTACPGSGKTRTIIYRLAFLSEKYSQSNKYNIAITYTNRAADEIHDRVDEMGISGSSIWSGTIHQFCLEFILRPYKMYSSKLKFGYTIIDEYVKKQYIKDICQSLDIDVKYNKYLETLEKTKVREAYQNLLLNKREIDFDLILSESFDLLYKNPFIRKNLASVIRSIQIDEYQDTSLLQYKIISEIYKRDKTILLSFVGDINQAIFKGLGSVALTKSELDKMFETNFMELHLSGCYRSTQQIIDYYQNYQVVTGEIEAVSEIADDTSIINHDIKTRKNFLSDAIVEIINSQLNRGIPENEICVLAPQWSLLFPIMEDLKNELKHVTFDASQLTPVKYNPLSPLYLITKLIFTRPGRKVKLRKQLAKELMDILSCDFGVHIASEILPEDLLKILNSTDELQNGIERVQLAFQNLSHFFGISDDIPGKLSSSYYSFLQEATLRITTYSIDSSSEYFYQCYKEREGIVVSTLHGIKGEEFDTVIAFGLLQGFVPHWDEIYGNSCLDPCKSAKHLLYVMCSRAKHNLYMFSEMGRKTKRKSPYLPTEIMLNKGWQQ